MKRTVQISTFLGALSLAIPAMADFEKDVLPVLENKCMACHREAYKTASGRTKKPKGGLRLDNPAEILKGGDSQEDGDASLTPKDSGKSLIYGRVTLDKDHDDFMPPEGKADPLTDAELKALKDWIDAGADFGDWKGTKFDAEGNKVE